MYVSEKNIIGELVAEDYRTAEVFSKHGIDFCCKGNLSILNFCEKKKMDVKKVVHDLNEVKHKPENTAIDFQSWSLDLLADYIEKKHHKYVQEKTQVIQKYLVKVKEVHGKAHPELFELTDIFNESARLLAAHMKKEELILFPFIRNMVVLHERSFPAPMFRTVQQRIDMMKTEHEIEGEFLKKIAELTNNYTPPAEACNTYKVTFALLKEFEKDLHLHIHLENNILFPKALVMASQFQKNSCRI